MRLMIRRHFDAAHQLPYHQGKCSRLHGHRWTLELILEGAVQSDRSDNPESGMLVDFTRLKAALDDYLPDHRTLNAPGSTGTTADSASLWDGFGGRDAAVGLFNPTAERIAERFWDDLTPLVNALVDGLWLVELRVWETPDSCAIVP